MNKSADKISVEGFADAKIPLKRGWRFEMTANWSQANSESLVDFEVSTERDATTNKIREWRKEGVELKYREFENGAVAKETTFALHEDLMPISSPFLLVSAFQSSVSDSGDSFGATLVMGSKFSAFRLDPVSVAPEKDGVMIYRGAILGSRTPLRRSDWLALPWHQAKPFDLDWDPRRAAISRIAADVPLFGAQTLNF